MRFMQELNSQALEEDKMRRASEIELLFGCDEVDNFEISKEFKSEMREEYSIFDENLNDGNYDYLIDNHSIPLFDEYSQEHDNDYHLMENDSPPTFDDYHDESEDFMMIEEESSPLFDDYLS